MVEDLPLAELNKLCDFLPLATGATVTLQMVEQIAAFHCR
jgi:hypothetical protein